MAAYVIPSSMVVPTDLAIILASLPDKYFLGEGEDGYYVFYKAYRKTPDLAIARVTVEFGQVNYEILDENLGKELLSDLQAKYPQCNPDRIVWGVFYQWYGAWAMAGQWADSPDGLTKGLTSFHLDRKPILVSFRAGDFDMNVGMSRTSQTIFDDGTVSEHDNGPILIELTNLESCGGGMPPVADDDDNSEIFRLGDDTLE